MQGTHAASNTARPNLRALEAQRYGDEPDMSGGLLGSTPIRWTDTDESCCGGLWQRMTNWCHVHPKVGHGAGILGGLLAIAAGAITLARDPDAKLAAALFFGGGGLGVIGSVGHCYLDTRNAT